MNATWLIGARSIGAFAYVMGLEARALLQAPARRVMLAVGLLYKLNQKRIMDIEKPIFHFITPDFSDKSPLEKTKICLSGIEMICEGITRIADQLRELAIDENWNITVNSQSEFASQMGYGLDWCQFHHENLLFRKYAVRERIWDIVEFLSNAQRRGNIKNFLSLVQSRLDNDYPEVGYAFQMVQKIIDHDVNLRNIATHEGFFCLAFFDPSGEAMSDGKTYDHRRIVKNALGEFIWNDIHHAENFVSLSLKFVEKVHAVI